MNFKEFNQLLIDEFRVEKLSDIAQELNVTPQVVNNWKNRNQVPYKYVLKLREKIKNKTEPVNDQKTYIIEKPNNQVFEKELQFHEILYNVINIVSNNYKLIIIINITFIILGFLSYKSKTPLYKATSKIVPTLNKSSASKVSGLAGQFGITIPSLSSSSNPEVILSEVIPDIINGRILSGEILKKMFYSERYEDTLSLFNIYKKDFNNPEIKDERLRYYATSDLIKNKIQVKLRKLSPVIEITTIANEPQMAKDLNESVLNELGSVINYLKNIRTKEKIVFIDQRLNEIKKELINSEEKLKKFRENNRNIIMSPALLLEEERIQRDMLIVNQIYTTLNQENELLQIEMIGNENILMVIDPAYRPLKKFSPRGLRIMLSYLLLGIILSMIIAFFKRDNYTRKYRKI